MDTFLGLGIMCLGLGLQTVEVSEFLQHQSMSVRAIYLIGTLIFSFGWWCMGVAAKGERT